MNATGKRSRGYVETILEASPLLQFHERLRKLRNRKPEEL